MQASERSMLVEHILHPSMPDNLALALDTADVIFDVQKQILSAGARALAKEVTESDAPPPLHCVGNSFVTDPLVAHAHLRFRRDNWPASHVVGIEADGGSASKVFVYVMTEGTQIDVQLKARLSALNPGGAGTGVWPWWYWLPATYYRWTTKEALLAFRSGEAVAALAAHLAAVVAIVDEFSAD